MDTPDNSVDGFDSAIAAFAKEDAPPPEPPSQPPAPVVEGDEPKAPEPEPAETPEEAAKAAPQKFEEEFIEFTGKQKERFNSVYGALKRLERENAALKAQQQEYRPPTPPPQAPPAYQPQPFQEAKPKLAEFETADQWGEAVADWAARKAEHTAVTRTRQEYYQEQQATRQQTDAERLQQFLNARTNEGYQKFGQHEFDNVCADVANFAPFGTVMHQTLFGLQRYPEVVMELGKNLQEADRISRLGPHDQIYEIKALEKKLIAKEALAAKTQTKLPSKVEAPGAGEEAKPSASVSKLRQAAKASGELKDFAAVFMADPTL